MDAMHSTDYCAHEIHVYMHVGRTLCDFEWLISDLVEGLCRRSLSAVAGEAALHRGGCPASGAVLGGSGVRGDGLGVAAQPSAFQLSAIA